MRKILSVSQDESLRRTRSALLRQTGAEVQTATAAEALRLLALQNYDLVVLCHTLAAQQASEIAAMAHQQAVGTRVLQLVSGLPSELTLALVDDFARPEPALLIAKAATLLGPC